MQSIKNLTVSACLLLAAAGIPSVSSAWGWGESTPTPAPNITPLPMSAPRPAPAPVAITPMVARAAFTTAIAGREPTNQLTHANVGQQIYYFTELVGLQGHVITHRWERDGMFQLGMQYPVGGEHWRVHSSKTIAPNQAGTWTVTVQNDDGNILRKDTLVVDPPMASTSAPNPYAPATPIVPPPSQPLTVIPPALQKAPLPATPMAIPTTPIVPPPSQPLTAIPPGLQKPPVPAPTSSLDKTPASAVTTPASNDQPIWEKLPR